MTNNDIEVRVVLKALLDLEFFKNKKFQFKKSSIEGANSNVSGNT